MLTEKILTKTAFGKEKKIRIQLDQLGFPTGYDHQGVDVVHSIPYDFFCGEKTDKKFSDIKFLEYKIMCKKDEAEKAKAELEQKLSDITVEIHELNERINMVSTGKKSKSLLEKEEEKLKKQLAKIQEEKAKL